MIRADRAAGPGWSEGVRMEMAIGIALVIISVIEMIWISRTVIANSPR
jgi:hypothetical protein